MFRVPVFGDAKMIDWLGRGAEEGLDMHTAIEMGAVGAPCGDDGIGPSGAFEDSGVIGGADGVEGGAHGLWVSVAPCEDVGNAEAAVAEGAGAPLAALDGGVVLDFSGG